MRYLSSRDHGYRIGNSASRTTVTKPDDTKVIQEKSIAGYTDEAHEQVEFFSNYGFTNVVQPPTGSGDSEQAAESIAVYLGSNRAHGVVVANGDRRYRLFKLANGEVAMHDDQGHQVHFKRDGIWASAPNSKKIVMQIMDSDTLPQDGVQETNGQKLGQTQQAGQPSSNNITLTKDSLTINHTGAVNINAKTIKLTASDHVLTVGVTRLGSDSASDNVYGKHGSVGNTTSNVFVDAELPGPPTSLDAQP